MRTTLSFTRRILSACKVGPVGMYAHNQVNYSESSTFDNTKWLDALVVTRLVSLNRQIQLSKVMCNQLGTVVQTQLRLCLILYST
jgi:hypothetical protein